MSFFGKLFGRADKPTATKAEAPATAEVEYKGFIIRARPFKEQGQFQTAGEIEKEVAGERKTLRFIRADRTPTADEASEIALAKGRLMVDQQGESLFR